MEPVMGHEEDEDEGGKTVVINLEEAGTLAELTADESKFNSATDDAMADFENDQLDLSQEPPQDLDFTAEELEEMIREAVKVDVFEEASEDWAGQPISKKIDDENKDLAEKAQNPTDEDLSLEEEAFAMRTGLQEAKKAIRARDAQIKHLKEKLQILAESSDKLKQTFMLVREQFEKTSLSNAKLLYTNRTLKSTSLNERQKNKIVDSIQAADSIEEAKVIYETLQSAVGESRKSTPKSLNEAISRPSINMPRRRRGNSSRESVVKDRFQALAGIKK
jgi:hypothetical protein